MIITNYKQLEPFRKKQGIYLFTLKEDITKNYAGKSSTLYRRIALDHKNGTGKHYIDYYIKEHGLLESFIIELIHWWDEKVCNWEVLALETAVIIEYNCLYPNGYNFCLFGSDSTGLKRSKETKDKISKKHKELYQNGYINPRKGKTNSEEHRKNLSISHIGFKQPQQQKDRQSLRIKGHGHPLFDYSIYTFKNLITNEEFIGYRYDFYEKYKLDKSNVNKLIKNKRKSMKGWILIKKEEGERNTPSFEETSIKMPTPFQKQQEQQAVK